MTERWLSVVGIGEDGLDGLTPRGRMLVDGAEILVGGDRHFAMLPEDGREKLTPRDGEERGEPPAKPETPTTTKDGNDDRGDKKARKKEEEQDEDFQISNLVSNYSPEKRKEWAIRHLVTKG